MTAGAAATGLRAWLGVRSPRWITPRRLKAATAALLAVAVLAAGASFAPSGDEGARGGAAPAQTRR